MFFKKKYERIIKEYKHAIKCIFYEWNKERELYDIQTKELFYNQKVSFVIEGVDIEDIESIRRPIFNITEQDAQIICEICHKTYLEMGYICDCYYKLDKLWYDAGIECIHICVDYKAKK